jgi:hypothetical protein
MHWRRYRTGLAVLAALGALALARRLLDLAANLAMRRSEHLDDEAHDGLAK